jgi:MFS family permease
VPEEGVPHGGSLWRNRDILLLWGGQAVSRLGSRVSDLALPLLVLALTRSPAQAGFVAAAQALLYLAVALPAGALADRWDRKRTMIRCDVVRLLAYGSIPLAYALGRLGVAQLYAVAVLAGGALAVFDAAEIASLPHMVPAARLPRAVGLNATVEAATYLLGPALAGILIGLARTVVAGAALAYLVDGLSYLASVLTLGAIRMPFQVEHAATPGAPPARGALRAEIAAGLRFLWRQHRLRAIALLTMGINLLDGPLVLAVIVLARDQLHADARAVGLILSLAGAGELLGSAVAPWVAARVGHGSIAVGSVAVWALAMPLEAAATAPAMLITGAALADMMISVYNVAQVSYRLALIPDALQGRVNSAYRLPSYAAGLVGTAAGGVLLGLLGPRPILWGIAAGLGVIAIAASMTVRRQG